MSREKSLPRISIADDDILGSCFVQVSEDPVERGKRWRNVEVRINSEEERCKYCGVFFSFGEEAYLLEDQLGEEESAYVHYPPRSGKYCISDIKLFKLPGGRDLIDPVFPFRARLRGILSRHDKKNNTHISANPFHNSRPQRKSLLIYTSEELRDACVRAGVEEVDPVAIQT